MVHAEFEDVELAADAPQLAHLGPADPVRRHLEPDLHAEYLRDAGCGDRVSVRRGEAPLPDRRRARADPVGRGVRAARGRADGRGLVRRRARLRRHRLDDARERGRIRALGLPAAGAGRRVRDHARDDRARRASRAADPVRALGEPQALSPRRRAGDGAGRAPPRHDPGPQPLHHGLARGGRRGRPSPLAPALLLHGPRDDRRDRAAGRGRGLRRDRAHRGHRRGHVVGALARQAVPAAAGLHRGEPPGPLVRARRGDQLALPRLAASPDAPAADPQGHRPPRRRAARGRSRRRRHRRLEPRRADDRRRDPLDRCAARDRADGGRLAGALPRRRRPPRHRRPQGARARRARRADRPPGPMGPRDRRRGRRSCGWSS